MSQNMTHTITLKAVDGTTIVFQRIGQSANAAAAQIETAGKRGARGLQEAEQAAQRTEAQMKKLQDRATSTGAALGTGLAVLSKIGQASETQRRQIQAIELAYGGAADEVLRFADSLQGTTRFSNDDVREAAAIAATLAQNYGFTTKEVERLIQVSANLASLRGIDLSDAVQRTSAAMRGEAEAAEFLGLTLNQQAIDREGLTLTMSNEEAAHFRLNALLKQAAFAEGAAGDSAETAAGQADQLRNRVQDLSVQFGDAIGPLSGMASGLADVALALPLIGAAAGRATPTIVRMMQALTAAGGVGGAVSAGAAGGLTAIGALAVPVGLTAAAIALLAQRLQEYNVAADEAADPTDRLRIAITRLYEAGQDTSVPTQIGDAWAEITQKIGDYGAALDGIVAQQQATINVDLRAELDAQAAAMRDTNLTLEERAQLEGDLDAILSASGSNREKVQADTLALLQSYDGINSTAPGVAAGIHTIAGSLETYGIEVREAAAGTDALGAAWVRNIDVMESQSNRFLAQAQAVKDATAFLASGAGGPEDLGFNAVVPDRQDFGETTRLRQLAEAEEEAAEATKKAAAEAEQHARDLESERAAALDTANALIGSIDEREQATQRATDAQEQYAERTADINESLAEQLSSLGESYADQTEAIAERRVDIEEQAAERMQDLNEARIDAAVAAEEALVEVSKQRAEVVANAAEQAQRAEQQWMQTSAANLDQQAEIRERLQETTAEAAQRWHDLNQQNLEQQREIRTELQATISEIQQQLHAAQQEAQRDLQRLAQDHRRTMAEFRVDAARIEEDLQLVLTDPRATAEQKNAAELAAQRAREDLARQRDDEELSHERAKEDIRRRVQEAEATAADAEAAARAQAREDYKQLAEERAAAQQAYQEQVTSANESAAEQIANLEEQRQAAFDQYTQQQADSAAQVADQLADLQAREDEILETRAEKYAEIEEQRRELRKDTAEQFADLASQAADAEEAYVEGVADAQKNADEARQSALEQYAESSKTELTELQRLRDEGLITEGEYQIAYDALIALQEDSKHLEDLRLIAAIDELPHRQALVDAEIARLEAAKKYHALEAQTTTAAKGRPTGDVRQQSPGITRLSVDDTEFDRVMTESEQRVDDFESAEHTTTLAADWTPFARVYGDATSVLHTFDTGTWTATLDADDAPFVRVGQDAHQRGLNFSNTTYTAELDGDDDPFREAVADADSYGQGWANTSYTAQISAQEAEDFDKAWVAAANELHAVTTNKTYYATISAKRDELDRIVSDIREEFDGKTVAKTYLDIVARVRETTTKDSTGNTRSPRTQKLLGGMAALGTLIGEVGSELAISGNRMWEVGASGPEWLDLASGTLIMPHGAAQARARAAGLTMRGMQLGGHMSESVPQMPTERTGRASGASAIYNYGTITLKVDNADVGAEIARQLAGQSR